MPREKRTLAELYWRDGRLDVEIHLDALLTLDAMHLGELRVLVRRLADDLIDCWRRGKAARKTRGEED